MLAREGTEGMCLRASPPGAFRVLLLWRVFVWGFLPPLFAAIFITVSLFISFPHLQRRIIVWIYGLPRATFPSREGARAG